MELSRRDGDWRAVCTEERGSEVTRWLLHFRQGMLVAWTEAAMDKSLLMVLTSQTSRANVPSTLNILIKCYNSDLYEIL